MSGRGVAMKSGRRGCARGNERGGVGSCEVRIGAWDEAGSLTRAEMRRRLSPSSSANTPPNELAVKSGCGTGCALELRGGCFSFAEALLD